jgi:hypothetical protein
MAAQVVNLHENHGPVPSRSQAVKSQRSSPYMPGRRSRGPTLRVPRERRHYMAAGDTSMPGSSCRWTVTANPYDRRSSCWLVAWAGPVGSRRAETEEDRRRAFAPPVLAVRSATPLPDGRYPARAAEAQPSRQVPEAREGDPRNHRADACESVQVTSNYLAHLGQDARRQCSCDKVQLRA